MPDSQSARHTHPAILSRARELRREMTPQEHKLWQRLRGKQLLGLRFRRQHPINRFILDFFCYEHKVAVEIDGDSHYQPDQQEYDQARTDWLVQHGIRVIRFTNRDLDANIEGVLGEIAQVCGADTDLALSSADSPPSNSPRWGEDLTSPQRGGLRGGEIQPGSHCPGHCS